MRKKKRQPLPLLQTGVGTIMSSMAISGFILGFGADQLFDTTPIFLLSFGLLGVIGGTMKAHKFLMHVPGQKNVGQNIDERKVNDSDKDQ